MIRIGMSEADAEWMGVNAPRAHPEENAPAPLSRQLFASGRQDYLTPSCVLDRVRRVGEIFLDPCGCNGSIVGARVAYHGRVILDPTDDGLKVDWHPLPHGLAFVNPPYDRIEEWTAKAHTEALKGCEVVLLCPARTDTRWWQINALAADAVCFWYRRIRFVGAPASAPFPSAILYFGKRRAAFGRAFKDAGWICENVKKGRRR